MTEATFDYRTAHGLGNASSFSTRVSSRWR